MILEAAIRDIVRICSTAFWGICWLIFEPDSCCNPVCIFCTAYFPSSFDCIVLKRWLVANRTTIYDPLFLNALIQSGKFSCNWRWLDNQLPAALTRWLEIRPIWGHCTAWLIQGAFVLTSRLPTVASPKEQFFAGWSGFFITWGRQW